MYEGLEILDEMTNEELDVLVKLIIDKGGITEKLTDDEDYIKYSPEHKKYTCAIKKEIIAYGSNTFFAKKSYKEIVCAVCDKLDVAYDKAEDLEHIEHNLLEKVLKDAWEKMTEPERAELLKSVSTTDKMIPQLTSAAMIGLFRAGGAAALDLSILIAESVSVAVGGEVLSFAAYTTFTRALSILTGPIGIALTAIWTAVSFAGPAYRVITPAAIYIASIREIYNSKTS